MAQPNDFSNLNFESFRKLAADKNLSVYERIGFPDSYRQGLEAGIFEDIKQKLNALRKKNAVVLDIGPGCSELPKLLIQNATILDQELFLVDSQEMLTQLPDYTNIRKHNALFPHCPELLAALAGRVDAILCYSVLHYAYVDTNLFGFLDAALALLAPGGDLLLGDIPNVSMRKRFFSSENGIRFHQAFMKTEDAPAVEHLRLEPNQIDDAVIIGLMLRARAAGFDAWVLPQDSSLPMANRREDILIHRP